MTQETGEMAIFLNLRSLIDFTRQFPQNVFLGTWGSFLFFDSDWIFDSKFVGWTKALLNAEGGTYACIFDLDAIPIEHASQLFSFTINNATSGEVYQAFLNGSNMDTGWIYTADRFACTSDKGGWCIYCERRNEIAAISLRSDRIQTAVTGVNAMPIKQALAAPLGYGFSNHALSPEWRSKLLEEYCAHSKQ